MKVACRCSECRKGIYEDEKCFVFPRGIYDPRIICEDCARTFTATGREAKETEETAIKRLRESDDVVSNSMIDCLDAAKEFETEAERARISEPDIYELFYAPLKEGSV